MANELTDKVAVWRENPTNKGLSDIVVGLDPTIHNVLRSMNAETDPYLKSQARVLAAGAVTSYNPENGARLETWVSRSLQPLRRERRMTQTPLKVPDRAVLDSYSIYKAENAFLDKHGREPDLEELADHAKLSVRRIKKVREYSKNPVAESSVPGAVPGGEMDHAREAADAIYDNSGYLDRKIMEHRTGYGGADILTPGDVAVRFKLSPSQVSKRSGALSIRISQLERKLRS